MMKYIVTAKDGRGGHFMQEHSSLHEAENHYNYLRGVDSRTLEVVYDDGTTVVIHKD